MGLTTTGAPLQGSGNVIGSAEIADDSIVNADINSAAAISFSKLASLTSSNILVGNASNAPASVAVSGDATIDNTGAVTIANDAVSLAKMASGTAGNLIAYDASGNPAAVATGTAGQVLTSNGAGAAPTFQAAAGGGISTASGSYTGDGTTDQNITGLGFQPRFVFIHQEQEGATDTSIESFETHAAIVAGDHIRHQANNYFQSDNRLISLDADGFSVSDDNANENPNTNTVTYVYFAIE